MGIGVAVLMEVAVAVGVNVAPGVEVAVGVKVTFGFWVVVESTTTSTVGVLIRTILELLPVLPVLLEEHPAIKTDIKANRAIGKKRLCRDLIKVFNANPINKGIKT